jgi:hypothetical protein
MAGGNDGSHLFDLIPQSLNLIRRRLARPALRLWQSSELVYDVAHVSQSI